MTARQLLPLSGVASVLLIVASFIVVGESPDLDAPASEVVSYYDDNDSQPAVGRGAARPGRVLLPALRDDGRLAACAAIRQRGAVAANFTLGGGIVFAVGATIFAGLAFTAGGRGRRRAAPPRSQTLARARNGHVLHGRRRHRAPSCSAPESGP